MIKEIQISLAVINEAKEHYAFDELKNSQRKGSGNYIGAIAELVIRDTFNGKLENTFDYDLIIKGKKIEVKQKQFSAGYKPQDSWNISIEAHNVDQKCDLYCFTLIPSDLRVMYLCGWIEKEKFYKKAILYQKGEMVPIQDGSGRTWKASCSIYALPIRDLD